MEDELTNEVYLTSLWQAFFMLYGALQEEGALPPGVVSKHFRHPLTEERCGPEVAKCLARMASVLDKMDGQPPDLKLV
jgi:hypothetical protein